MARSILNGAAVSSTLVVTGTAAAVTPVIIKGAASQSVALQEWHNSAGTPLARMGLSGYLQTAGLSDIATGTGPFVDMTASGVVVTNRTTTSNVPLVVKGMASQTGDLQQWQNSAGTALARILGDGRMYLTNSVPLSLESAVARSYVSDQGINMLSLIANGGYGFTPLTTGKPSVRLSLIPEYGVALHLNYDDNAAIGARDVLYSVFDGVGLHIQPYLPSHLGLRVRGQASQTADLQQWQTSDGTALAKVAAGGDLITTVAVIAGPAGYLGGNISVSVQNAGQAGIVVKGAASQTANLTSWQNSAGTVLASVRFDGMFRGPFLGEVTDTGPYIQLDTNAVYVVNRTGASNVPLAVVGMAGQTGDLQRWKDSAGAALLAVNASGTLLFGTAQDTNLYRAGANILKTDDALFCGGVLNVQGDIIYFNGSQDTNLYRSAANTLKSDDAFEATQVRATDNTTATRLVTASGVGFLQAGPVGGGAADLFIGSMFAGTEYAYLNGTKLRVGSGVIYFGSAEDTNLYRAAANTLKTDDEFISATNIYSTNGNVLANSAGATRMNMGNIFGNPGLLFGSAEDTSLYREAADVLRTDDEFRVNGTLRAMSAGNALMVYGAALFGSAGDTQLYRGAADRLDLATGDSFRIVSGQLQFSTDVNLYREIADWLATDDNLSVHGTAVSFDGKLSIDKDGTGEKLFFGSAEDTNLYRWGANVLKTDDVFQSATDISAGGYIFAVAGAAQQVVLKSVAGAAGIEFGSAGDTNLYRSTANTLATDDTFAVGGRAYLNPAGYPGMYVAAAGNPIFQARVDGDANARIEALGSGAIYWGSGSGAADTNLYRSAANVLKTDDNLVVTGYAQVDTDFVLAGSAYISSALFFNPGADVMLFRGAANRLDLATGDSFRIVSGELQFSTDVNLYRSAANRLRTDDVFHAAAGLYLAVDVWNFDVGDQPRLFFANASTNYYRSANNSGTAHEWRRNDDVALLRLAGDATLSFGSAGDTNLYRQAANVLKTDDALQVAGALYLTTDANAGIYFGTTSDTNLYRSAANTLKTDDSFVVNGKVFLDVTGYVFSSPTNATDGAFVARAAADTHNRYMVRANGFTEWGSGSAVADTNLYRQSATVLQTDGTLLVAGYVKGASAGSGEAFRIGDDAALWDVNVADTMNIRGQQTPANGQITFGSAGDTNLYRAAANILATDDPFVVGGRAWLNPAGYPDMYVAAAGNAVFQGRVDGDTQSRIWVYGSGQIWWSSGSVAHDTNLYRAGADHLKTDDQFTVGSTLYLGNADTNLYRHAANILRTDDSFIAGDAVVVDWSGGGNALYWGPAQDTNLYRSAANTLKTDDNFIIGINGGKTTLALTDTTANVGLTIGGDTNLYRAGANLLKTDDDFLAVNNIAAREGAGDRVVMGNVGPGGASGILFQNSEVNLYRSAADVLKTDDLFDASVAGLRTKHEAGSTPTGGTSGEVRVGTEKLWFQDAGTWRSLPAPAYPTMIKFGSD